MNDPVYKALGISDERTKELRDKLMEHYENAAIEGETDLSHLLGMVVADSSVSDVERHYMCFHLGFNVGLSSRTDEILKLK